MGLPSNWQWSSGSSLFFSPLVVHQHFPKVFSSLWATAFHQDTRVFLTQGFQSVLIPLPLPPRDASLAPPAPGHSLPPATAAPQHLLPLQPFSPSPFPAIPLPPALSAPAALLLPHPFQQLCVFTSLLQLLLSEDTSPSTPSQQGSSPPSCPTSLVDCLPTITLLKFSIFSPTSVPQSFTSPDLLLNPSGREL